MNAGASACRNRPKHVNARLIIALAVVLVLGVSVVVWPGSSMDGRGLLALAVALCVILGPVRWLR